MSDAAFLDALVAHIRTRIPKFEIRYKDESWFMKFLAVLVWIFNRRFMSDYTTTVAPKVYFPSRAWAEAHPRRAWKVLAHEYVHLFDWKRSKLWFSFSYLLPQILALGALGAIGAIWCPWQWAWAPPLGVLLLAFPWGSPWRTQWELRGYTMSMAVNYWRYGSVTPAQVDHIVKNFTGFDYYRMCPSEKKIRAKLNAEVSRLQDNSTLDHTSKGARAYRDVYHWMKTEGLAKVKVA